MVTVYMFDVDETLSISGGPITPEQLLSLRKQGHIIGMCGNFALVTHNVKGWHYIFSHFNLYPGRKHQYLIEFKKWVPADRYVMIGNKDPSGGIYSDDMEAKLAGWEFVAESDFKEGLE